MPYSGQPVHWATQPRPQPRAVRGWGCEAEVLLLLSPACPDPQNCGVLRKMILLSLSFGDSVYVAMDYQRWVTPLGLAVRFVFTNTLELTSFQNISIQGCHLEEYLLIFINFPWKHFWKSLHRSIGEPRKKRVEQGGEGGGERGKEEERGGRKEGRECRKEGIMFLIE